MYEHKLTNYEFNIQLKMGSILEKLQLVRSITCFSNLSRVGQFAFLCDTGCNHAMPLNQTDQIFQWTNRKQLQSESKKVTLV